MSRQRPSKKTASRQRSAHVVRSAAGHARSLIVVPIVFLVVVALSFWCWQLVRTRGLRAPEYTLQTENITVNEPPQWITADDVRMAVIRDASLDQPLSILDDKLTERIALAFAAHPWVARVERVEKFYPARVEVTVVYREPVAVVVHEADLLPVDRYGVRLPDENFSRVELGKFPRVRGITFRRRGTSGIVWGDPRVQAAALIATAFHDTNTKITIGEIIPAARPIPGKRNVYAYRIVTSDGFYVEWGRQYLEANPSEPSAEEKCQRLKQYLAEHGSLEGLTPSALDAGQSGTATTARSNEGRARQ